jgi:hypothetical protein
VDGIADVLLELLAMSDTYESEFRFERGRVGVRCDADRARSRGCARHSHQHDEVCDARSIRAIDGEFPRRFAIDTGAAGRHTSAASVFMRRPGGHVAYEAEVMTDFDDGGIDLPDDDLTGGPDLGVEVSGRG